MDGLEAARLRIPFTRTDKQSRALLVTFATNGPAWSVMSKGKSWTAEFKEFDLLQPERVSKVSKAWILTLNALLILLVLTIATVGEDELSRPQTRSATLCYGGLGKETVGFDRGGLSFICWTASPIESKTLWLW